MPLQHASEGCFELSCRKLVQGATSSSTVWHDIEPRASHLVIRRMTMDTIAALDIFTLFEDI